MTDVDAVASRLIECQYANGHLLCYANRRAAITSIIAAALRECVEQETKELQSKLDEAEAQAAVMRDALTKCQVAFGDGTIANGPKNGQGTYYAIGVAASVELALSSTAGRDLLAEVERLRVAFQDAVAERVALESKWMKIVEAIQLGPLTTITPAK